MTDQQSLGEREVIVGYRRSAHRQALFDRDRRWEWDQRHRASGRRTAQSPSPCGPEGSACTAQGDEATRPSRSAQVAEMTIAGSMAILCSCARATTWEGRR